MRKVVRLGVVCVSVMLVGTMVLAQWRACGLNAGRVVLWVAPSGAVIKVVPADFSGWRTWILESKFTFRRGYMELPKVDLFDSFAGPEACVPWWLVLIAWGTAAWGFMWWAKRGKGCKAFPVGINGEEERVKDGEK